MKKFLVLGMALLGFSAVSYASVNPPVDRNGITLPTSDWSGVDTCRINYSTSTAVLCASGAVLVYGVGTSSIAATDYLTMFDTSSRVLNGTVAKKVQFNDTNQTDEDVTATQEYSYVRPIKFGTGLVIRASAQPGGAADWQEWVVYYRPVTATE